MNYNKLHNQGITMDSQKTKYVVTYAKFVESKESGSELHGVYFGGSGNTIKEAQEIAKSCVNSSRGDYILPKIAEVTKSHQVVEILYDAQEQFEKIQKQMAECYATIQKTSKKVHTE